MKAQDGAEESSSPSAAEKGRYRCLDFDAHRSQWDSWLANALHGSSLQVSAHLASYRQYRAEVSLHVIEDQNGNLLAGAAVLSWRVPLVGSCFGEANGAPMGEVAWWPILLKKMSHWAQERRWMCLGVSPHVSRADPATLAALSGCGFLPGKPLAPLEHLAADLRVSLEGRSNQALLASFRRQTRQNILNSLDAGHQIVSPTTPEDIAQTARFLHGTATENGVSVRPLSNFVPTVSGIVRSGAGYAALVEQRGEPMAAGVFVYAGQAHRCYQLATKRTNPDSKAAYFLHWNAITRARDQGAKWYHFTGRSVPSVYQFKRGFRPEEFDLMRHYRLVFHPAMTAVFEHARPPLVRMIRTLFAVFPRRCFRT